MFFSAKRAGGGGSGFKAGGWFPLLRPIFCLFYDNQVKTASCYSGGYLYRPRFIVREGNGWACRVITPAATCTTPRFIVREGNARACRVVIPAATHCSILIWVICT